MSTSETLDLLRSRILAGYPLMFLNSWEERRWEGELSALADELQRRLVTWSVTLGCQPPLTADNEAGSASDPLEVLEQIDRTPGGDLFLLKDFHPYLKQPQVIRKLRDLAQSLPIAEKTILLMGPEIEIPRDLLKDAVQIDLPLPDIEELRNELSRVLQQRKRKRRPPLSISGDQEERMLKAVVGLTSVESHKALTQVLINRDKIDDTVYTALVSEKKHLIQGSELLDFQDLDTGVRDVGGLEQLKDWIARRALAFSTRAQQQGIPAPRGVLLLGVQGCGKSLTACAIAHCLSFPLVRLDIANLLSADLGSSERRMREVLKLMQLIAPAVLWLDEIEKGFAGSGEASQNATMSRLMGSFLSWMQDRRAPVFVVATANSVTDLPPELLRRGRFDELFFIDLPNFHERRQILGIHLQKRGWKPDKYDIEALASLTEGYSGAEIEQIVVTAMIETYSHGRVLSQEDLQTATENLVPLSVTMEEKIFQLREWARGRCRQATPDSRVLQMLEKEHGRDTPFITDDEEISAQRAKEWVALAEHGQTAAAILEYVRARETVLFSHLQRDFSAYAPAYGEQGLALRSDPNAVLWVGLPQELAEPLAKLIAAKRIYVHIIDAQIYDDPEVIPKLPQVATLPEKRLSRPVWLPVVLREVAPEGASSRLQRVARMRLSK